VAEPLLLAAAAFFGVIVAGSLLVGINDLLEERFSEGRATGWRSHHVKCAGSVLAPGGTGGAGGGAVPVMSAAARPASPDRSSRRRECARAGVVLEL
jgi:hypothetical protein